MYGTRNNIPKKKININGGEKMKYSKNSINFEVIIFLAGTYGERIFIGIHKFICQMNPEVFGFVGMVVLGLFISYVNKK